MPRDSGLEELVHDEFRSVPGISEKAMFGGWAWLLHGNLLCGARSDGMLVRLGKGRDAWALEIAGVVPMVSRGKVMSGWVRADGSACGDDSLRRRLLVGALEFVRSLPPKAKSRTPGSATGEPKSGPGPRRRFNG